MTEHVLDLRHLRCPLPVLRTKKALKELPGGAILVVECTDPLAGLDIPHLLRSTGDALVDCIVDNGIQRFTIRKA